LHFLRSKYF